MKGDPANNDESIISYTHIKGLSVLGVRKDLFVAIGTIEVAGSKPMMYK